MAQPPEPGAAAQKDDADPWRDDAELARRIVRQGEKVLENEPVVVGRVGRLVLLTEEENGAFDAMRDRITAYLAMIPGVKLPGGETAARMARLRAAQGQPEKPKRPLCLGVFGPPGSGKSFGVEEMLTEMLGSKGVTLNLSQLEGPRHLAEWMKFVKKATPKDEIPVVFFDEFDSQLAGTPRGWLQWLLAPMNDGKFVLDDDEVELKNAVFIFAGGTADTFEDFQGGPQPEFRAVKGPDFVSRLRGHLDVRGVNSWPYRRVRRAMVLRRGLEQFARDLFDGEGRILPDRMADAFIDQLLAVGRYRHGARSVEALVEMSTRRDASFTAANLPPEEVRANHVDLGPLADTVVALSAGGVEAHDFDPGLTKAWTTVATRLLEQGAALVYGGNPDETGLLRPLVDAHERLPRLLPSREMERRPGQGGRRLRPATLTWVRHPSDREKTGGKPRWADLPELEWPGLSEDEYRELGLEPGADLTGFLHPDSPGAGMDSGRTRLGYAVTTFRMRALVTRHGDVHLAFGGREKGFKGRFPGVAEEVMLSLAAGTPVYLCGGFGGATRAVGQVLGLGSPWAAVPSALRGGTTDGSWSPLPEDEVRAHAKYFQLPYHANLPVSYGELVDFFRGHAMGTPGWPENGLTPAENRTLFGCKDAGEIFELVEKGLRRLREPS